MERAELLDSLSGGGGGLNFFDDGDLHLSSESRSIQSVGERDTRKVLIISNNMC